MYLCNKRVCTLTTVELATNRRLAAIQPISNRTATDLQDSAVALVPHYSSYLIARSVGWAEAMALRQPRLSHVPPQYGFGSHCELRPQSTRTSSAEQSPAQLRPLESMVAERYPAPLALRSAATNWNVPTVLCCSRGVMQPEKWSGCREVARIAQRCAFGRMHRTGHVASVFLVQHQVVESRESESARA